MDGTIGLPILFLQPRFLPSRKHTILYAWCTAVLFFSAYLTENTSGNHGKYSRCFTVSWAMRLPHREHSSNGNHGNEVCHSPELWAGRRQTPFPWTTDSHCILHCISHNHPKPATEISCSCILDSNNMHLLGSRPICTHYFTLIYLRHVIKCMYIQSNPVITTSVYTTSRL